MRHPKRLVKRQNVAEGCATHPRTIGGKSTRLFPRRGRAERDCLPELHRTPHIRLLIEDVETDLGELRFVENSFDIAVVQKCRMIVQKDDNLDAFALVLREKL